jgi:hypothetical protein
LKPLTDIEEKDSNYRKLKKLSPRKQIFNEQNELINAKVEIELAQSMQRKLQKPIVTSLLH